MAITGVAVLAGGSYIDRTQAGAGSHGIGIKRSLGDLVSYRKISTLAHLIDGCCGLLEAVLSAIKIGGTQFTARPVPFGQVCFLGIGINGDVVIRVTEFAGCQSQAQKGD